MTDFLLELLSEEIPARMQEKACADLARLFAEQIYGAGLVAEAVQTYSTPRRLALIARGLPDETVPITVETKGPKVSAPQQAIDGFLRRYQLTLDELEERDGVYFAVRSTEPKPTASILGEAARRVVFDFPWPKSMRWGAASQLPTSLRWVRPLQGIVALFGEDVVPFVVEGIAAGAATVGHRFHHPGIITIGSAADYAEKLRMCHVIVDAAERRRIIRDGALEQATSLGLVVLPDDGLVAENAGLTEWPVPLIGEFDPEFLTVPPEVIQLTMRTNQKYFALLGVDGQINRALGEPQGQENWSLAPAFICTANIEATDGGAAIVAGNRKVLAARLSDARFFWEQDLRVPLAEQAKKLSQIVFHEKLGTVADKVERVAKLARWLVEEGIVSAPSPQRGEGWGEGERAQRASPPSSAGHPHPTFAAECSSPGRTPERPQTLKGEGSDAERASLADLAETAARLCKADLVTGMVGEFPELQGVMGGYYARAEGLDSQIADAIRDHYKPVGQGDDVPTAPVTVAVSLADKLDTLFAFYGIDEPPSGSRDPFALRRAILGVARVVLNNNLRLSLRRAFEALAVIHEVQYGYYIARYVDGLRHAIDAQLKLSKDFDAVAFETIRNLARAAQNATTHLTVDGYEDNGRYPVRFEHRDYIHNRLWFPEWESVEAPVQALNLFAADRLKVQQREAGVRHDLIDAVFALGGEDDLVRLLARVKALQAFVATEDGVNLLAGYKRAANILRKEGSDPAATPRHPGLVPGSTVPQSDAPADGWMPEQVRHDDLGYTPEPAEAALLAVLDGAERQAQAAVAGERFKDAMAALAMLRAPIDAFFEGVTVNDPNPAKRSARLALLARIRAAVHEVADFSKIEG